MGHAQNRSEHGSHIRWGAGGALLTALVPGLRFDLISLLLLLAPLHFALPLVCWMGSAKQVNKGTGQLRE